MAMGDSVPDPPPLLRLTPCVLFYDWGTPGSLSSVARLNSGNSPIDPDRPYAELWIGTHPSAPATLQPPSQNGSITTLHQWLQQNPAVLGPKVLATWGSGSDAGGLPFLFKLLSVAKALSIQAHPDKLLAETLHQKQPHVYRDNNHKPEMALAITEFKALCGFISGEELHDVLRQVPEILDLVGDSEQTLQSIFTNLMSSINAKTVQAISNLKSRLQTETKIRSLNEKEELVLEIEKQYPNDIGVISAFLLNYIKLNPGEALYIGANEPHAYLHGECIECMAASDNVVRAGLTHKYIDTETLCSMLTYKQGRPEILKGFPISPCITRYLPPFDEFEVDRCELRGDEHASSAVFPAVLGPSVFLVVEGEGVFITKASRDEVREGDVLFAPADIEITITTSSLLTVYRAGVNSRFLQTL